MRNLSMSNCAIHLRRHGPRSMPPKASHRAAPPRAWTLSTRGCMAASHRGAGRRAETARVVRPGGRQWRRAARPAVRAPALTRLRAALDCTAPAGPPLWPNTSRRRSQSIRKGGEPGYVTIRVPLAASASKNSRPWNVGTRGRRPRAESESAWSRGWRGPWRKTARMQKDPPPASGHRSRTCSTPLVHRNEAQPVMPAPSIAAGNGSFG